MIIDNSCLLFLNKCTNKGSTTQKFWKMSIPRKETKQNKKEMKIADSQIMKSETSRTPMTPA